MTDVIAIFDLTEVNDHNRAYLNVFGSDVARLFILFHQEIVVLSTGHSNVKRKLSLHLKIMLIKIVFMKFKFYIVIH